MTTDLIVVGGGAAGMMAAIAAGKKGSRVCLVERNPKMGRKLYITGKGRCNVTNHCAPQQVLESTPRNSRFLYGAVTRTPPEWVEDFFSRQGGVPLKVERGNRVFPQSDKAADIIDALVKMMREQHVQIIQDRAQSVLVEDGQVKGLVCENGTYHCKAVILATGGASYPATGSTGDGYDMAREHGHTILPPTPSLVPLEAEESFCAAMQGLALKNVTLKVKNQKKKVIFQEQGELLFTHFGLSGPLVLSASAHMRDFQKDRYTCIIDLKPALDEGKLDARLLRELGENANKDMHNILGALLPRLMVPVMLEVANIAPDRKAHDVTREERRRLLEALKAFPIHIKGPRPIAEAIVTSGGVKVGEVDPKTMASKKVVGLYFAGELLDVDAYTGGYNLQIAWATGRAAGESAADYVQADPQDGEF